LENKKISVNINKYFIMTEVYIRIYNTLVHLSRNEKLYSNFTKSDTFSDRLILLFIHFAFFLKIFKNDKNLNHQKIYDFFFRQIELNLREIGYGDQTINKRMKEYIHSFHYILKIISNWSNQSKDEKKTFFLNYFNLDKNTDYFLTYFSDFEQNLKKNNLNYFLKSVDI